PFRRAPEGEIYGTALLFVVEGRKGRSFLEGRAIAVIDPEVERVVCDHPQHQTVAEHAGLTEHAAHCDAAERSKLLLQELGETVAGNHAQPSFLLAEIAARDDDLARVVAGDAFGQGDGRFANGRWRLVAGSVAQRVETAGPVLEILGDDMDDVFLALQ